MTKFNTHHFPSGTVVKLNDSMRFGRDGDDLVRTVMALESNGIRSYVALTGRYQDDLGTEESFNICHVEHVLKRGSGPLVIDNHQRTKHETLALRDASLVKSVYASKGAYCTRSLHNIIDYEVLKLRPGVDIDLDLTRLVDAVQEQTWVRTAYRYEDTSRLNCPDRHLVFVVNKKRLRRFLKQNFNRFLLNLSQAEREYEEMTQRLWDDESVDTHDPLFVKIQGGVKAGEEFVLVAPKQNELELAVNKWQELGYEHVLTSPFKWATYSSLTEEEQSLLVYANRKTGCVIVATSYNSSDEDGVEFRLNGGDVHYAWVPKDWNTFHTYTSSGGVDGIPKDWKFNPSNKEWAYPDGAHWRGYSYVTGLQLSIQRLAENGTFLPIWPEGPAPITVFLTYSDWAKGNAQTDWSFAAQLHRHELQVARYAACPQWFRDMTNWTFTAPTDNAESK